MYAAGVFVTRAGIVRHSGKILGFCRSSWCQYSAFLLKSQDTFAAFCEKSPIPPLTTGTNIGIINTARRAVPAATIQQITAKE
jgi:hypothetical protein